MVNVLDKTRFFCLDSFANSEPEVPMRKALYDLAIVLVTIISVVYCFDHLVIVPLTALDAKIEARLPPSSIGGQEGEVVRLLQEQNMTLARLAQRAVARPITLEELANGNGVKAFAAQCIVKTVGFKQAQSNDRAHKLVACVGGFAEALERAYLNPNEYALVESLDHLTLDRQGSWKFETEMMIHRAARDPAVVAWFGQRFGPVITAEINKVYGDQRADVVSALEEGLITPLAYQATPEVKAAWDAYQVAAARLCVGCVEDASMDAVQQKAGEDVIRAAAYLSTMVPSHEVFIWRMQAETATGGDDITKAWLKVLRDIRAGVTIEDQSDLGRSR